MLKDARIMRAKNLRKNMSDMEKRFWYRINRNQLGVKFRRQQPIGPYIVDFFCPSLKLVIELDGEQHAGQIIYDNVRTDYIQANGYVLIRIPNSWLVGSGLDDVVYSLGRCIKEKIDFLEYFVSKYDQ